MNQIPFYVLREKIKTIQKTFGKAGGKEDTLPFLRGTFVVPVITKIFVLRGTIKATKTPDEKIAVAEPSSKTLPDFERLQIAKI